MRRSITAIVLSVILIVGGLLLWATQHNGTAAQPGVPVHQKDITLGDGAFTADIADTPALREQGLSGRQPLDDAHGMLFVFEESGIHVFWMKDMLFSIDMLWLSPDKRVIYIAPNASPKSYPATFAPSQNASYVIEVAAGWAERHHVTVGSVASF